ncbi:MAG TPA: hypothetical protein VN455_00545 [Methanotrichaceae archaeon]|nr:hypothetical protein [Methanotrichaceae archaeon]
MAVKKFSISLDGNTYAEATKAVETGDYRNLSHFFEQAAKKLLRERELARQASEPAAVH